MEKNKLVVITGANTGIGLATARDLASKGYDIITLCRDKNKGDQTVSELMKINAGIKAENFVADLSDLSAVQKAANDITNKYPIIDRLINNAGYYPSSIEYEGDVEKTLLASHLGHMLFTRLLLSSLQQSPESRIINVSSALYAQGSADRFFKQTKGHSLNKAYADAKLANILFTMELVNHLPSQVSTYSLHPGVVQTGFAKGAPGFFSMIVKIMRPFFITPEKGAETSIYLTDTDIKNIKSFTGQYFADKKHKKTSHKDLTGDKASWLWNKSMEILKPYLSPKPSASVL